MSRTPKDRQRGAKHYWDAIDVPILIIRGRNSDLLPSYLAQEMARRNPRMVLHDVPGCGDAPTLMTHDQIEPVTSFIMDRLALVRARRPMKATEGAC